MKSGIQGVRSSVGSDQCAKIFVWNPLPAVQSSVWQRHSWHGLLLLLLHTSTKGTMMLLSLIGALHLDHLEVPDQGVLMNFLAHLHFSKKSSTTCCYLPPLLSETRDHLCYNGIASWTLAQSVLYRCNSQRRLGGFEAVQLWSHKSTFKIYLKSQILNLFEMSNISNLFEMSSSTSVWNQRSPLIQSHCFMNTCTECSGCSQIRQMVVFWLPSIVSHFPWQTLQCTANADQSPSYIGL